MEDQRSPAIRVSIALVMLFQVSALIVRSFVQMKMVEAGLDAVVAQHLSALVGFAVLAILMWPIMIKIWPSVNTLFRRPVSWTRMILASIAIGALLWLANMLALLAFNTYGWTGQGPYSQSASPIYFFACSDPAILLLSIPVMSLLTPLIEEVINRGLLLQTLLSKGKLIAIFASALLFAVLHSPESFLSAFVFGIFAAIQMLRYQSLWAPVIMHSTINLLVEVDKSCLEGYRMPGDVGWNIGVSFLLVFLVSIGSAWCLVTRPKAGAGLVKDRPDSFNER